MSERRSLALAFCTGQSRPGRTALSPAQASFLEALPLAGVERIPVNFPYHADPAPHLEAPLLRASVANGLQYLRSRSPGFRERYRPALEAVFEDYAQIVLLAGSCGLELLRNLELSPAFRRRCHVFAYGPVARGRIECASLCLVQGGADLLSRWYFREVDHRIPGGHLAYLEQPETRVHLLDFCRRVLPSPHVCPG